MSATIIRGDARALPLPDASVDLIVTSPPYYALRSYTDGGEHYDGQIGAESTPAEYIDNLIACTREWTRVLKPTGSLFVNLGDSYSSGKRRSQAADYAGVKGRGVHRPGAHSEWTKATAAWLAAVLDCEGSVSGRVFTNSSGGDSFVAWMRVGMMDREVVERIYEITGVGRVFQDGRGVWNWHVAAQAARYVLERIWPWLRIKQRRALAAIELCRHIEERAARGGRTLTTDDLAYRMLLVHAIRDWNAHPSRANDYEPPRPQPIELPDRITETPAKGLLHLPERYRIACTDRLGLIGRAVVIWSKVNSLPESVTDRVRASHEDWIHLVKRPRYYSAIDHIRQPHQSQVTLGRRHGGAAFGAIKTGGDGSRHTDGHPLGALPGSVWEIPTEPLTVPPNLPQHFAAMPTEWPRRIILGWSPSGICTACGEGRRPVAQRDPIDPRHLASNSRQDSHERLAIRGVSASSILRTGLQSGQSPATRITGEACGCPDTGAPTRPAVVADPFGGTGTTALVAHVLGRHCVSVDMSADYCRTAQWRTTDPGQIAKAMRVDKPARQLAGQADLLAELDGGAA